MAEAWARHLGAGVIEAESAGLFPASIIQPETIAVMEERGIKLEPRSPRSILLLDPAQYDVLVNMAGVAVSNVMQGFGGRVVSWQVRDPIGQKIEVYRAVRDQIEQKVRELVEELRGAA
jgi:arsenate reductase